MAKTEAPRIAVLGGGPIGLEAALYGRVLDLPVTLYERGRIGEHVQRWGHVRLFSPFGMNATPLGKAAILADASDHQLPSDSECVTGKEYVASYLEPLAKTSRLKDVVHIECEVLYLGRYGLLKGDDHAESRRGHLPFRLLVREKNRERIDMADIVLDCTGTYGQHRWMGDGGIPAVGELAAEANISYGLEDILGVRRSAYAGKSVLVVGAGYSAATTVCNLAALSEEHLETSVVWLARGSGSQPIKRWANDPLRERDRLAAQANMLATRGDGNVEFHKQAILEAVETAGTDKGFHVTARCAGKPRTWTVDRIIANVGYTPGTRLHRELQVQESPITIGPAKLAAALLKQAGSDGLIIGAQGAEALGGPEPHFFVLGAKSYGRISCFFLRTGFAQIREVFAFLTGKPTLDLYQKR
jgi:thioredoxin reductase